MRRVFITGLGWMAPGISAQESLIAQFDPSQPLPNWSLSLKDIPRHSSNKAWESLFLQDKRSYYAARIQDETWQKFITPLSTQIDHWSSLPRHVQMALYCANQARWDAGCHDTDPHRFSVYIGTGLGAVDTLLQEHDHLLATSPRRIPPRFIADVLPNTAAARVASFVDAQGEQHAPVTACAAGLQAIVEAAAAIQRGDCDVALAGGVEACLQPVTMAGFMQTKALSPTGQLQPFSKDRNGMVLGEGGALLFMESESHFNQRRHTSQPYAMVLGGACSMSAKHITQPDSFAMQRAIELALKRASLEASSIDWCVAHATGTILGDAAECEALKRAGILSTCRVSAFKQRLGHLLGASGAVEVALLVAALRQGQLLRNAPVPLDPTLPLMDYACEQQQAPQFVLKNAAGFGGVSVSAVFSRI